MQQQEVEKDPIIGKHAEDRELLSSDSLRGDSFSDLDERRPFSEPILR